jgi:hypothetical protein
LLREYDVVQLLNEPFEMRVSDLEINQPLFHAARLHPSPRGWKEQIRCRRPDLRAFLASFVGLTRCGRRNSPSTRLVSGVAQSPKPGGEDRQHYARGSLRLEGTRSSRQSKRLALLRLAPQ